MDQVTEMAVNRTTKKNTVKTKTCENRKYWACTRWVNINYFSLKLREHQNKKLRADRNELHIELGEKGSYIKRSN